MTKDETARLEEIRGYFTGKVTMRVATSDDRDALWLAGLIDSLTRKLEIAEGALNKIEYASEDGCGCWDMAREALKEIRE